MSPETTDRKPAEEDRRALHARAQQERARADRAERRAAFLTDVGAALADRPVTLPRIAELTVHHLADWCVIDLAGPGRGVERLAAAHRDPVGHQRAGALRRRFERDGQCGRALARVLRTGRTQLDLHATDASGLTARGDARERRLVAALGVASYACVPLTAGGRTLGAFTVVCGPGDRCLTEADLVVVEDVGRRLALALDHARLEREVRDSNHYRDQFLALLSHELRTPLTALLGWLRVLRNGPDDAGTQARALTVVERNGRTLAQLIEDLLDVSRIVMNKVTLEREPVEAAAVVAAAVEALLPAAHAGGLAIDVDVDVGAGAARIIGDRARLTQVVLNLLSNAIKFTPAGGRVGVRLRRVGDRITLAVADTGEGIPPEFLPDVFDHFRQAERRRPRAQSGLGLGLAIVRGLVELHGGEVQAASAGEGRGATFTVTLPAA